MDNKLITKNDISGIVKKNNEKMVELMTEKINSTILGSSDITLITKALQNDHALKL